MRGSNEPRTTVGSVSLLAAGRVWERVIECAGVEALEERSQPSPRHDHMELASRRLNGERDRRPRQRRDSEVQVAPLARVQIREHGVSRGVASIGAAHSVARDRPPASDDVIDDVELGGVGEAGQLVAHAVPRARELIATLCREIERVGLRRDEPAGTILRPFEPTGDGRGQSRVRRRMHCGRTSARGRRRIGERGAQLFPFHEVAAELEPARARSHQQARGVRLIEQQHHPEREVLRKEIGYRHDVGPDRHVEVGRESFDGGSCGKCSDEKIFRVFGPRRDVPREVRLERHRRDRGLSLRSVGGEQHPGGQMVSVRIGRVEARSWERQGGDHRSKVDGL